MQEINIIKIGGNVIDDDEKLNSFMQSFAEIKSNKILVHGGGKIATKLSEQLGIKTNFIEGRRVTNAESLNIATMVYAGLINKKIIALLQKYNCNALGLSGADGNIIQAKKRDPIPVDYGFVGDIESKSININLLENLISLNISPVFSAITHDKNGNLLNTNADTIASVLAIALSKKYKTNLIFCFEENGVLADINNPDSIIKEINKSTFEILKKENKIFAGMIPKITNALNAIEMGVNKIVIGNANHVVKNTEVNILGTKIC